MCRQENCENLIKNIASSVYIFRETGVFQINEFWSKHFRGSDPVDEWDVAFCRLFRSNINTVASFREILSPLSPHVGKPSRDP